MRNSNKRYGSHAIAFGIAAIGIYLLMVGITLNHIELLTELRPFDMRPGGYSPQQAHALLEALGTEGRQYYLRRQIPLDLIYPALMALTLISFLKWLESQGVNRVLSNVGIWLSVGAAMADYLENVGICTMILSWPDLADTIVHAASAASIAKAGLTTFAVLIVIICLGLRATKWMRIRPKQTSPS